MACTVIASVPRRGVCNGSVVPRGCAKCSRFSIETVLRIATTLTSAYVLAGIARAVQTNDKVSPASHSFWSVRAEQPSQQLCLEMEFSVCTCGGNVFIGRIRLRGSELCRRNSASHVTGTLRHNLPCSATVWPLSVFRRDLHALGPGRSKRHPTQRMSSTLKPMVRNPSLRRCLR